MPTIAADDLSNFASAIFKAAGTPQGIAEIVPQLLVLANLTGHDSQGIIATLKYVGKIRSKDLVPNARPKLVERRAGTASIDCGWGFGQIGARFAALVCEMIPQQGIACVALQKVNHIGRLGKCVQRIAEAGYIGLMMTTGSMLGGQIARYGGRQRRFGTNPMAWGVPVPGERPPLIPDFATSAYAAGKVAVAVDKGENLPDGILIDSDGHPTHDPAALNAGGALLPFGSYKGYGLSLVIELVVSILSGFGPAPSAEFQQGNPTPMIALSIDDFITRPRYEQLVAELLDNIRQTQPTPGFDAVLLPGDAEQRAMSLRSTEGIPVPRSLGNGSVIWPSRWG
jgi:LDH2 family malate/lactate/ureidoglycolate dehydrogenase